MRALGYSFRLGWAGVVRGGRSAAIAVLTIALALVVLGTLLLITWNGDRLLVQWSSAAEFSVYLRDDATSEERGAIEEMIDRSGAGVARSYMSKADALAQFRREFTDLGPLAASFEGNPFPASVEVRLRPEAESDGRTEGLVRALVLAPGVADVGYDSDWLGRMAGTLRVVRVTGLALAALMALAAAVTVAAVVRLGLYARRDEIEIMELVGAPLSFIRGPFVVEGLLQGGIGALTAVVVLGAGFAGLDAWWGSEIRAVLGSDGIDFLPVRLVGVILAGGMLVGSAGGFMAARHAA